MTDPNLLTTAQREMAHKARREGIAVTVLPTCAMRSLKPDRAAELAVQYADALIAELDK